MTYLLLVISFKAGSSTAHVIVSEVLKKAVDEGYVLMPPRNLVTLVLKMCYTTARLSYYGSHCKNYFVPTKKSFT